MFLFKTLIVKIKVKEVIHLFFQFYLNLLRITTVKIS